MNTAEFNLIFDQTIERCRQTLCNKAIEYAENDDRLHNFHVAAGLQGNTPIEALGGMMVKHTVSVFDMIRHEGKGASYVQELWQEKIKDSINYLILLQAMVSESSQTRKDADKEALCKNCKYCETSNYEYLCNKPDMNIITGTQPYNVCYRYTPVSTPASAEPIQGGIMAHAEDNASQHSVCTCKSCRWYDNERGLCMSLKSPWAKHMAMKSHTCEHYASSTASSNQCISCGADMPEGGHVCVSCARR